MKTCIAPRKQSCRNVALITIVVPLKWRGLLKKLCACSTPSPQMELTLDLEIMLRLPKFVTRASTFQVDELSTFWLHHHGVESMVHTAEESSIDGWKLPQPSSESADLFYPTGWYAIGAGSRCGSRASSHCALSDRYRARQRPPNRSAPADYGAQARGSGTHCASSSGAPMQRRQTVLWAFFVWMRCF